MKYDYPRRHARVLEGFQRWRNIDSLFFWMISEPMDQSERTEKTSLNWNLGEDGQSTIAT